MAEIYVNKPLIEVDIVDAIAYYGVYELLDTIGVEKIEHYLADVKKGSDAATDTTTTES